VRSILLRERHPNTPRGGDPVASSGTASIPGWGLLAWLAFLRRMSAPCERAYIYTQTLHRNTGSARAAQPTRTYNITTPQQVSMARPSRAPAGTHRKAAAADAVVVVDDHARERHPPGPLDARDPPVHGPVARDVLHDTNCPQPYPTMTRRFRNTSTPGASTPGARARGRTEAGSTRSSGRESPTCRKACARRVSARMGRARGGTYSQACKSSAHTMSHAPTFVRESSTVLSAVTKTSLLSRTLANPPYARQTRRAAQVSDRRCSTRRWRRRR
jgi:hypothetical protein